MPRSRNLAPVLIGAVLALAAGAIGAPADEPAVPVAAPAPAPPDLSGVWNLDPHASDDLEAFAKDLAALRSAAGSSRPGGPGGAPGEVGGGMGGGALGGRMPADELGSPQEVPAGAAGGGGPGAVLARAAQQLLISVDGQTIEVVDGADRAEVWVADGEARALEGVRVQHTMRRATWQQGVLVLEQLGGALANTRRLHLAADGRRLVVELSVPGANSLTAHLEYTGVN